MRLDRQRPGSLGQRPDGNGDRKSELPSAVALEQRLQQRLWRLRPLVSLTQPARPEPPSGGSFAFRGRFAQMTARSFWLIPTLALAACGGFVGAGGGAPPPPPRPTPRTRLPPPPPP